eukprot:5915843-Alexandrium_andersonii.AAC.1
MLHQCLGSLAVSGVVGLRHAGELDSPSLASPVPMHTPVQGTPCRAMLWLLRGCNQPSLCGVQN